MTSDKPKTDLPYKAAVHAMQTGVALEGGKPMENKHLRVGVNSAKCDHAALVKLLVAKGIITDEEYREAIRLEMCHEVDRYQERLPEGTKLR